ncbi:epoxyqueuosine reductase QueH [Treponema sp.]|uniref:epoxyqueuosine reductase QueH n=1 Tax=Treponema sp. TaxID=166 RepID=UPI00298E1DE8|nr:epoxyqueuosine reductase QueH [Treponema sp.]MCR5613018.1 epoxyqueuosine reductase QueH [Treponema sp.]
MNKATIQNSLDKNRYQKITDKILSQIQSDIDSGKEKPSLLLHACCAPCSSYVLEYLSKYFAITIFYYNPNIHPETEYTRRLNELKAFLPEFAPDKDIKLVEAPYNTAEFFSAVRTEQEPALVTESERGERCRRCYELRMKRAFEYASEHGFDWFTTTLSISPYKDADKINQIGAALSDASARDAGHGASNDSAAGFVDGACSGAASNEQSARPQFLTSDFKKRGGFLRSLELSKEYNLYRQDYCGCIYSKQNMLKNTQEVDN